MKRNGEKDPAWKGAVHPAQGVVIGHGGGAGRGADEKKVAGVILLAPPGPLKAPDKYKGATRIVSGEEGQEAASKIYGDLQKPRYLFSVSGLDKSFMPPEKAGKAYGILWSWLGYRAGGRDELKSWVVGQEVQELVKKGDLKQAKAEE